MDLHAGQIQGFFNIPVDHLYAAPVLIEYLKKLKIPNLTLVSPDAGGVERARAFAKRLGADLAIVDKRRVGPNQPVVSHVIGTVSGRNVLICDDIVDTARTLVKTIQVLRKKRVEGVYVCATHAVLSGRSTQRLRDAPVDEIILTDTVPLIQSKLLPNMTVLSVAGLLAKAIKGIHEETSISNLFV